MQELRKLMTRLIAEYKGPKISIVACGAGTNLTQLLSIPGASRIMHGVFAPYSKESIQGLLDSYWEGYKIEKFFAPETSQLFADLALDIVPHDGEEVIGIGICGALTTNRWRKGDNGAFISLASSNEGPECNHMELPKLSEAEYGLKSSENLANLRLAEDLEVCSWVVQSLIDLEII